MPNIAELIGRYHLGGIIYFDWSNKTASTFITSFDYQPVSVTALSQALFSEVRPSGKLPVTITEPPPSTRVLYPFGFGLSFSP